MRVEPWIEFYFYGVILTSMCLFGISANTVTLFILNAFNEMRKQPINVYLTVLAIYDNGVLIMALLMLGIPALVTGKSDPTSGYPSSSFSSDDSPIIIPNGFIENISDIPSYQLQSLDQIGLFKYSESSDPSSYLSSSLSSSTSFEALSSSSEQLTNISTYIYLNASTEANLIPSIIDLAGSSSHDRSHFLYQPYPSFSSGPPDELDQQQSTTVSSDSTDETSPIQYKGTDDPLHYYVNFVYPMALISQTGSIWTTCLITAERYFAVCHPFRIRTFSNRNRAIWAVIFLSIGAFVYNIPRFIEVEIVTIDGVQTVRQTELRQNRLYYWLYYICLHLALLYIIPLSLLFILNTEIYKAVRRASRNRATLTNQEETELNIASMLVLLVFIFIACNAPAFAVNCMEFFNAPGYELATIFSNLLVCFNSSINFVIYCIFGKKFRNKLEQVFRCSKLTRNNRLITRNNHNNNTPLPTNSFHAVNETYV